MRNLSFLLIGLIFFSCKEQSNDSSKDHKEEAVVIGDYSIEDFYKSTSVGGGIISPDGNKMIINSNETWIYVYEIDLATGEKTQLSFSEKETYMSVGYMPNDKGILYMAGKGGNELNHIYLLNGDETTDLTPGENVKAGFSGFNQDKSAFYFTSNERDPRFLTCIKWIRKV